MKYNIVTIDPSLISTALVVSSGDSFKMYNYCRESKVFSKKGITKWFGLAEGFIEYKYIKYREYDNYSEGELIKLKDYDAISDSIIKDIQSNIDINKPTKIGIEGYSFSSSAGDIIDLVTFSTILRKKLFDLISQDILVLSPSTLKLESCKLTYEPILKEIGKRKITIKKEWRNNIGIPGGNFTKTDIFLSIIENNNWNDYWTNHCKSIRTDILAIANIPKPYEDINDSFILYKILESYCSGEGSEGDIRSIISSSDTEGSTVTDISPVEGFA